MDSKRPNLVLIMTDQHRGDALGCAGHPHLLTPTLDGLAGGGVRFSRAYSECPTCIPARHALITGRTPQDSGVVGFHTSARIERPDETLPEVLRRAGYQTASIGRSQHLHPHTSHYGFEMTVHSPFEDPYSEFRTIFRNSEKGIFGNWPHLNGHGSASNGWNARPWPYEERFHETNWSAAQGIAFLDRRDQERPFFLSLGFVAPHPPLVPPAAYFERYARRDLDSPVVGDWVPPDPPAPVSCEEVEVVLSPHANQVARSGYYGLLNHVDDQLHLFLSRLRMEKGPTWVLFTSDHGEMLGDHHGFRKAMPFEAAAHIPMILSGPDTGRGVVDDRVTALVDIFPTFCDLAGAPKPVGLGGRSLLESAAPRTLHLEHAPLGHRWGGWQAVTDGRWKYIYFAGEGRELVFDLEKDPRETVDRSQDHSCAPHRDRLRTDLIGRLANREEGFVRDGKLVPGAVYRQAMSHARLDSRLVPWEKP